MKKLTFLFLLAVWMPVCARAQSCVNYALIDFSGGTNGNVPAASDLLTGTHGVVGSPAWHVAASITTAMLTYETAAHTPWNGRPPCFVSGGTYLDTITTFNNTNPSGGTNNVLSNSTTTNFKDLCVADTVDGQYNEGTLTAGTTLAWTIGQVFVGHPTGSEYFLQSSAGAITATFNYSVAGFMMTGGPSCYK